MARENAIIAVAELDRIAANGLRATGSSVGPGGVMDGDGYSNPAWGIGDVLGGLFVGIGRLFAACNVPNEIQPAVPPAGLFGPDAVIPWERFPGYTPPPDWTHPWERPDIDPGFSPPLPFPMPDGRGPSPAAPDGVPGTMMARPPSPEDLLGGPRPDEPDAPGGGGLPWSNPTLMGASGGGRPWIDFDPTMPLRPLSREELIVPASSVPPDVPGRPTTTATSEDIPGLLGIKIVKSTWRMHKVGKVEGAGGTWHGRFESKGWYYDYKNKVYVHRTQGSELHVGSGKEKKVYRSRTARISVEATSGGGSREISADTDLGEYFEKQRRSAELEATGWMALFIGGSIATIGVASVGGIGVILRGIVRLAGIDAEAWYDSCLGFRSLRGGGWSFGRRIQGWPWRVDYHGLPSVGRRAARLPRLLRGRTWQHYHRRGPGGIGRHRPWESGPGGFWGRF